MQALGPKAQGGTAMERVWLAVAVGLARLPQVKGATYRLERTS